MMGGKVTGSTPQKSSVKVAVRELQLVIFLKGCVVSLLTGSHRFYICRRALLEEQLEGENIVKFYS